MSTRYEDRVMALAAIVQAASLVHTIAESGHAEEQTIRPLLQSLIAQDTATTIEVYGSLNKLKPGLRELHAQLSQKKHKDVVILRYMVGLLHLERKLSRNRMMLDTLSSDIERVPAQIAYFDDIMAPQVMARFADIYKRTISTLNPQIHVVGNPDYLQQSHHADKVRALLLAGIRSAVLWHQKGGRRWQFMFPNKILTTADKLLHQD